MRSLLLAFLLCIQACFANSTPQPSQQKWSFRGMFGTFDRHQLQRGFQVYKEICAACHGLNLLHYRDLEGLGYGKNEIKAIAAGLTTKDINDEGEAFDRPRLPYDKIWGPYANDKAARAANHGALPPDLSVIIKARPYGPDYVYALMTGFHEAPAHIKLNPGMHYNTAFAGNQIAMAPPLHEGSVTYADGTKATVEQMAQDVAAFLSWASDPHQEERKALGFKVLIYLFLLSGLFYVTMRRIWSRL